MTRPEFIALIGQDMRTSKSFSPPATLATYNGPHTWPRGANIASRAPNFTKWMVEQ